MTRHVRTHPANWLEWTQTAKGDRAFCDHCGEPVPCAAATFRYQQGDYLAARDARIVQAIVGLPMRLKAHRAAHNLSGREVAKRCGISFATVSRIESGEDYMVSSLVALAAYLDGAQ